MLFFVPNYFRFNLLGEYDKKAMIVSAMVLGIWVIYFGPSESEVREHLAKKDTRPE